MSAITKTEAIRQARASVSIHGSGTSWFVYGPYYADRPDGPSTEYSFDGYEKARLAAAARKAEVAVALMGRLSEAAQHAINVAEYDAWADHSVEAMVKAALAAK